MATAHRSTAQVMKKIVATASLSKLKLTSEAVRVFRDRQLVHVKGGALCVDDESRHIAIDATTIISATAD